MANTMNRMYDSISMSTMNPSKPNPTLIHSKRSRHFRMQSEYCPFCSKNGAKVRVKAYQLNLEEAVFMCSTPECTWPVGYHELLFMDRPLGKYWTKDWPVVADKFLAEHLKKQRDSLSELSAYTPPQTPGTSKDAIHDTVTTGPLSLPVVKEIIHLDQKPSTSRSKPFEEIVHLNQQPHTSKSLKVPDIEIVHLNQQPSTSKKLEIPIIIDCTSNDTSREIQSFEIPVIDCTEDDKSTFENMAISLESDIKSEKSPTKVLAIEKDNGINKTVSHSDVLLANPFVKHSVSLVNKPVAIKNEKPSFVPEKSITSENVQCTKYRVIGKKKSKSFTYKKQFDIFEDIKKAKSTNEKSKVRLAMESSIDLNKMKPNEKRDKLLVNSKSKTNDVISICKLESTGNERVKSELEKPWIKEEKTTCQSDVNSKIGVEKRKSDPSIVFASSLIQTPNGDHDSKVMENVSLGLSSKEFSNDQNVQYDVSTMMITGPAESELDKNWSGVDHNLDSLLAMLEGDMSDDVSNNLMINKTNGNASGSNATFLNDPVKDEKIDSSVSKELQIDVDSIIDDDTLQCTIEDTDDPFFASLFSPTMNH